MIRYLFGMQDLVKRRPYILWGCGLMALKYAGEVGLWWLATGALLTPMEYFSPMFTSRYPGYSSAPDWFVPAVVLWTLPFVWIGTGMSIRRAADADFSPWLGLLFFVPGFNYLLMLLLSFISSSPGARWELRETRAEYARPMSALLTSLVFAFAGLIVAYIFTNVTREYLNSLFVGSPLILGLLQGYVMNKRAPAAGYRKTVGAVFLTVLMIHLLLMIFALEGVICLLMSFPLATMLALIGMSFGVEIARFSPGGPIAPSLMVFALPLMPLVESAVVVPHQDMVLSVVEVDVPPDKVWPNVVKFSDLPPTDDWLFKLGVAHPVRARIEGTGVGAVRRCQFSTGDFVEPITVWDEPSRLAFDVRFQPAPMKELSFYDHVDAPHLDGYFRSVRGEFRLVPLDGGSRTRLEGRTWYEMDMHPGWYWQVYGRWFIHKIHLRVLAHVKGLAEAQI